LLEKRKTKIQLTQPRLRICRKTTELEGGKSGSDRGGSITEQCGQEEVGASYAVKGKKSTASCIVTLRMDRLRRRRKRLLGGDDKTAAGAGLRGSRSSSLALRGKWSAKSTNVRRKSNGMGKKPKKKLKREKAPLPEPGKGGPRTSTLRLYEEPKSGW